MRSHRARSVVAALHDAGVWLESVAALARSPRVISITTEERRATVKYAQSVVLDKALQGRLEAAGRRIERPLGLKDDGERTREGFVRDDSGTWSLR
jgi:hypothetical protein